MIFIAGDHGSSPTCIGSRFLYPELDQLGNCSPSIALCRPGCVRWQKMQSTEI